MAGHRGVAGAANLCQQVKTPGALPDVTTFAQIEEGITGSRLVFNTLVEDNRLAEQRTGPAERDFARILEVRTLGEQMLRLSYSWPLEMPENTRLPDMTPLQCDVFGALVGAEIARVDFENTQWLKKRVDHEGWPKSSKVGEKASNVAWLLVQHADHDPAFQLQALLLMEPLVVSREVSPRSYAYLYDRITLKLKGIQRYATQVTCENGKWVPRPLEVPNCIDELRAGMELEPFAEYLTWFSESR